MAIEPQTRRKREACIEMAGKLGFIAILYKLSLFLSEIGDSRSISGQLESKLFSCVTTSPREVSYRLLGEIRRGLHAPTPSEPLKRDLLGTD